LKAGYSKVKYLHNISTSKVMEVLDELIVWLWKIPDNRSMMTNVVDHDLQPPPCSSFISPSPLSSPQGFKKAM